MDGDVSEDGPAPAARVAGVSLDCADPVALAGFYQALLGGVELWRSADSVGLRVPGVLLVMQRVDGYRPPRWPGSPIVHLDLAPAGRLDDAVVRAVKAGGVQAEFQPDPRWRVMLDPAGHPFCLTTVTLPDSPLP